MHPPPRNFQWPSMGGDGFFLELHITTFADDGLEGLLSRVKQFSQSHPCAFSLCSESSMKERSD